MIQRPVLKSKESESTALGAIYMVGLSQKIYTLQDIAKMYAVKQTYLPNITRYTRDNLFNKWEKAVKTTLYDANKRGEK